VDVARISIINNGKVVKTIQLGSAEMIIGRGDDAAIQLKHPLISRKHARLFQTGAGFIVEDEGTKNGTFVKGRRVQRHRLEDGDELEIADFILRYHADGYVPAEDDIPAPAAPKGMIAGDRKAAAGKSPLESYMEALRRGGSNATAAIPPAAMAKLREEARKKATPKIRIDGGEPVLLEAKETRIGWGDGNDLKLAGRWLWVKAAALLTRDENGIKLRKLSFWVIVRVDGKSVSEAVIQPGQKFFVGKREIELLPGDAPF
jgi:hypothetical protein